MSAEKLFTPEELKELCTQRQELIQASIDAGDKEKAKKQTRQMYREFSSMHDIYRDWVAALISFVARHYGDEAAGKALEECFDLLLQPLGMLYAGQDARRRAAMVAAGIRGHLQNFTAEEDDEKFTFFMKPCGSGARLVLEGKYGPPYNFVKIKKAQDMTFQQPDFPSYCAHCFFQNTAPLKTTGKPVAIVRPPHDFEKEPCRTILYKDPEYCPDEYKKIARTGTQNHNRRIFKLTGKLLQRIEFNIRARRKRRN